GAIFKKSLANANADTFATAGDDDYLSCKVEPIFHAIL
ncbi:MAG: hypothetical protein ACI89D_001932, partial [Bermanella sp.]